MFVPEKHGIKPFKEKKYISSPTPHEGGRTGYVERCVSCGCKTQYLFNTPVSEREDYIEGIGQLCHSCYINLQGKA